MPTLKAPFNFVPLGDKVFFPEWADQISHDVPFSDGLSGELELTITAETPILVGAGPKEESDGNRHVRFVHTPDGRPYIPGSTLKGTIRNVLEIMSYGKMTRFDNSRYSIRALAGADYDFYKEKIKPGRIFCGWMWKEGDDKYYLQDCGIPRRISVERIDHKLGTNLDQFVKGKSLDLKKDENRTAKTKYGLTKGFDLSSYRFSDDQEIPKNMRVGERKFVVFNDQGKPGTIVFTGQPDIRKTHKSTRNGRVSWKGKYFEFVFLDSKSEPIELDRWVVDDFKSVHKNSPDFKDFRKAQLEAGEKIPVFFMRNDDGSIDAIGLAYMFRYPTFNSVESGIGNDLQDENRHDLAECIFGFAESKGSLKGRVQFSHAFVSGTPLSSRPLKLALATPNSSYYPLYLGNGYTWNSESITIAGRKRYPVRGSVGANAGTDAMSNIVHPLEQGNVFKGKVRFHNLRHVELGALLAAITWLGDDECRHNIGMAKPLGYGKVKISVAATDYLECQTEFEQTMEQFLPDWRQSDSITELLAMARGIPAGREAEFSYMKQDNTKSINEFKAGLDAYAQGEQLGRFTQILSNRVPVIQIRGNVNAQMIRIDKERDLAAQKTKRDELVGETRKKIDENCYTEAKGLLESIPRQFMGDDEVKQLLAEVENAITEENKKKQDERTLVEQAKQKEREKAFDEAISLLKTAQDIGLSDFSCEINHLNDEKIRYGQSLAEFLESYNLNSAAAFVGKNQLGRFSKEDIRANVNLIAEKIRSSVRPRDLDKWLKGGRKHFESAFGNEITELILNLLK